MCTGNLLALTCGIAISWSSPVNQKLQSEEYLDENPLGSVITDDENSWIGSLLALGAVFGPFPSAIMADRFGRKLTLLILAVPFIISFFMLAFAETVGLYYGARFLAGAALGGVFTVIPMFIGEIAEVTTRGMCLSTFTLFITGGILLSYVIGPFISIMYFNIVCAVFPILFFVLFLVFIPESPFYLVSKNQLVAAEASLKKLRNKPNKALEDELDQIKDEINNNSKGSFKDLFQSRGLIKALIISMALVSFQQFSGINIILFYTEPVFSATGSDIPASTSSIIIGAVQLVACCATPLVVERLGRRLLLFVSAVGMLVSEVPLGLYFYLKDDGRDVSAISWLPIVSLIVYIITYNFGFGPLPWTVMGELFPSNVKSTASSLTASICWLLGFVLTKFFTAASEEIGMAGSFWLFAGFCLLAAVFVFTYVPETKGKTFQEIQSILNS